MTAVAQRTIERRRPSGALQSAFVNFNFSRSDIVCMAEDVGAGRLHLDAALAEARHEGDVNRVAALLLVSYRSGRPPTTADVAPLLPDVSMVAFIPLIAAAQGDRIAMLLDAADSDQMSLEREAVAAAVVTQLLDGQPPPARLKALVRRCVRDCETLPAVGMLDVAAAALGDEDILTVARERGLPSLPEARDGVIEIISKMLADPLFGLSKESAPRILASGFTARRVEPKIGRNDPCPCGSGKKYKKCCAIGDDGKSSAAAAGAQVKTYSIAVERLSPEAINGMSVAELSTLELAQLRLPALVAAVERFAVFRRFDAAERALRLLAERNPAHLQRLRRLSHRKRCASATPRWPSASSSNLPTPAALTTSTSCRWRSFARTLTRSSASSSLPSKGCGAKTTR